MKHHLNTLFVTTEGSYLAKEGRAVVVRRDSGEAVRVPLVALGGIVCFGRIGFSPALLAMCADAGVAISFCTEHGRFLANVQGFTPGNVLLRREQYRRADDEAAATAIARTIVAAKIANSRGVLLRRMRDGVTVDSRQRLVHSIGRLGWAAKRAAMCEDLDALRGIEGDAAGEYFGVFDDLIVAQKSEFFFRERTKRPPLDRMNSVLSFLYAMLAHDARSACEAAGLDAAVGFLHRDRPGRAGLALDLMEEMRACLADRTALTLVNRQQIRGDGFRESETGAYFMDDATRKAVLVAYQERKRDTITHPFLGEKTTVGLLIHLQARLLARHLRGDLDAYPAFIWP